MVLMAVLMLSGLTGFQVSWTVEPATSQANGLIDLEITIVDGDLLFIVDSGEEAASYEVVASLDDGGFDRASGAITSDEAGNHMVYLVFGDLESERRRTWQEEIEIPLIDQLSWSSGSIQIPSASLLRAKGSIAVLWEVYSPSQISNADSVRAAYLLHDRGEHPISEGWMTEVASESDGLLFSAELSLDGVDAGELEITTAAFLSDEMITSSNRTIRVLQNWDVWGENLDDTIRLVRPIATNAELNEIEDAANTGERLIVMSDFWLKRDSSPLVRGNEFLEEYLRRLDYISLSFSVHNINGITTDQGMVYALLGEPDIVEDRPIELSTIPFQIWTYFSPAATVVFVDRDGYGQYELETPWKDVTSAYEHLDIWRAHESF
jgi:GWxTD domain-containing protein